MDRLPPVMPTLARAIAAIEEIERYELQRIAERPRKTPSRILRAIQRFRASANVQSYPINNFAVMRRQVHAAKSEATRLRAALVRLRYDTHHTATCQTPCTCGASKRVAEIDAALERDSHTPRAEVREEG